MAPQKKKIPVTERRDFIMEGRKEKRSFAAITRQMIEKFGIENLPKGYDKRQVQQDWRRAHQKRSASRQKTQQRREMILNWRSEGLGFEVILTKLQAELGADNLPLTYQAGQVQRDFQREVQRQSRSSSDKALENQVLNQQRLNILFQSYWRKALEGDLKAAELALKILTKRSELHVLPANLPGSDNNLMKIASSFHQKTGGMDDQIEKIDE